jgi:hypothetical protein
MTEAAGCAHQAFLQVKVVGLTQMGIWLAHMAEQADI